MHPYIRSSFLSSYSDPQVGAKLVSPKPISAKISTLNCAKILSGCFGEITVGTEVFVPGVESTHVTKAERPLLPT